MNPPGRVHPAFTEVGPALHLTSLASASDGDTDVAASPDERDYTVNSQRYGRLAGVAGIVVAGALALTACGSDDNSTSAAASGPDGGGSSDNCVSGTFNAAGSSAQANAMDTWIKGYQEQCGDATVNYQPSGSGAGIESFTNDQVVFAGSDSALKAEEKPAADDRCAGGPALDLPMVVGPIAVAYNLEGVDDLQLSPATIAGIFAAKITTWNEPAIAKDNPGADLPATRIQAFHRSDESGTTDNFTKYLTATAPSLWTYEGGKVWTAPGGQGASGSQGVTDGVKSTAGGIGYVELSYADNAQLGTAKVKNGAGEFTALTTDTAAKTIEAAKPTGRGNDLSLEIDYTTKAKGAYPIVLVTYEIVCESGLDGDDAEFVRSFLRYTSGSDGQQQLSGLGYAPLPRGVQHKVQAVVDKLS